MIPDWACLDCGALNAGHTSRCEACSEPRRRWALGATAAPSTDTERPRWTPAPLEECVPVEQVRALISTLAARMGQETPVKPTPASLASSARTDLFFAERQLEYWREAHPDDLAEIGLLERKVSRLRSAAGLAAKRAEPPVSA